MTNRIANKDLNSVRVWRTIRYRTPNMIWPADGATNILIKKHQKKTWFSPKVLQGSLKPISLLTLLLQLIVISLWLKNSSGQLLWQPWTIRPLFSCFTWVGTVLSTEAKVREKYMSDMVVESWTASSKFMTQQRKYLWCLGLKIHWNTRGTVNQRRQTLQMNESFTTMQNFE